MEEISITINGKGIRCRSGTTILKAASDNNIEIPTLCNHPHLEPAGACRICIVEETGSGRIFASCVTPAAHDMSIVTDSPAVKKQRRDIISLMLANHPESCIVCNRGNRCELRRLAAELGVGQVGLYPMPLYTGLEDANPFITRDLSKCILCGRCIRADHELVMVGAIDYNLRGFESRPATAHEQPLEKSSCTFCGTCVSICPTGALVAKSTGYVGSPQRQTTTLCGFCGAGCSLVMGVVDNQVIEVNPSHDSQKTNRSTLCVRGHFAHDFLNSSDRLTFPLVRKDGELTRATWEEALGVVSDRLLSIRKISGPQSIAFYGSSKCSIEENYLFQKMARVAFETNNIDNGGYLSGRTVLESFDRRMNQGGRLAGLDDLEKAPVIFVAGADPTRSCPVLGYSIKRASGLRGARLIVADPRKTGLAPFASTLLPVEPHSDPYLIHGLAALLLKKGHIDRNFIDRHTTGSGPYFEAISSLSIEEVSRVTGCDRDKIEEAADILAFGKTAFVIGHGIMQQKNGSHTLDGLINLALMTGSLGGQGEGFYFVSMENNEPGALDMGSVPDLLPGRQPVTDDAARKRWERVWKVRLSPDPGLNIVRMVEEAKEGNIKAMFVMGENPLRCLPQPGEVFEAFNRLDFLVVQDILDNETVRLADVVLPAAAFSEKQGSFTSMEGRIQGFERVVNPPEEAKADWEILDELGVMVGLDSGYGSIERIRHEIRRLVPAYSGLDKEGGSSWIKEASNLSIFDPDMEGNPVRFTPFVTIGPDASDSDYPFKAIIGSVRFHLGCGTRTARSERIARFGSDPVVHVSTNDCSRLGIDKGDTVRISSQYGRITRLVEPDSALKPGMIFIPRALNENDAMNLLALTSLEAPGSPGLKETAVKIDRPLEKQP